MGAFHTKIRVMTASDFQPDLLNRLVESQPDMLLTGRCVDQDWLWHQAVDGKPDVLLFAWRGDLKPALLRRIHTLFPELIMVWLMLHDHASEQADEISQIVSHVIYPPFATSEIAAAVRNCCARVK